MLQIAGDLEDLAEALGAPHHKKRPLGSGSCSALVKVLPGNSDIYVSHDTWTGYNSMLRILKKYDFSYRQMSGYTYYSLNMFQNFIKTFYFEHISYFKLVLVLD